MDKGALPEFSAGLSLELPPQGHDGARFHFMDVARALFMVLGIPFHVALAYTSAPWIISSPDHSLLLEPLPSMLSVFRIPGFFLIGGFFAALMLERRAPFDWLKGRVTRLAVPLLTGIAVIVPLQNLLLDWYATNRAVHAPQDMTGIYYSHLWFLPVMLAHCLLAALVWRFAARWQWPDVPVWLAAIITGAWLVTVRGVESVTHFNAAMIDGLFDLEAIVVYLPYFVWGIALRRNPATFARVTQLRLTTAAAGAIALYIYCESWQSPARIGIIISLMAAGIGSICILQTILAVLARFANRPSALIRRLVDASFTIYLFHHPVIVALTLALLLVSWPPLIEWAMACAMTLAGSYALHQLLRRSGVLLFLFNGVTRPHREPAALISAPRPS